MEPLLHPQQPEPQSEPRRGVPPRVVLLGHPLEVQQHRQRPALGGDARHVLAPVLEAAEALLVAHVEGAVEGQRDLRDLPGVHVDGAAHDAGGGGEFGEDADAAAPSVRGGALATVVEDGVLVRHGELQRQAVEPVAEAGHQHHVGRAQQRDALAQPHLGLGALPELDGARPPSVDGAGHGEYFAFGPHIIVPAFVGADAHLHEDEASHPVRPAGEEAFQPQHL
mmetsp:Transcript_38052/g.74540  ORF Transcript_38052/g.74540 Transcript_38052/m.74540 type:complete len:224 (-) Transcript_38052:700-1371(-)